MLKLSPFSDSKERVRIQDTNPEPEVDCVWETHEHSTGGEDS